MFFVIVYNSICLFYTGKLCRHSLYGKYCDQNCSSHCNSSFECHQGNMTCIGGCQDGWGSDRCDKGMPSTNCEMKLIREHLFFHSNVCNDLLICAINFKKCSCDVLFLWDKLIIFMISNLFVLDMSL